MIDRIILSCVAALLAFAVVDDLRNYRVRNVVVLALLGLYVLHVLSSGNYAAALPHVAMAALLFLMILLMYARGWMGGGDAKLLGAAFLWLGEAELSIFSLTLVLLTLVYIGAAKLKLLPSRGKDRIVIPFAPCIAGAWLLTIAPALFR